MSENTVKLGLMPPLTGLVSIYGPEIARAGHIACQEVNQNGGVLGRPLELIIEDDGSLPETAVAAAKKLVVQHQCSAIIGNLLSNSRIAVAYRVAEPHKIPLLNFSFYEGSILSRYFFHFAALPNQQIDRMIPYMQKKYGPRMFFAGNNYEWPRGSIHAAKRVLLRDGGEVLGEEYCPIGVSAEEIELLLDKVEASAADVFVPYFAGLDQVNLLTRFTERGLKQRMAVVMGHYDEMMASQLPPAVREGFYSSNTYFMTVDNTENHNFLTRLANYPGVDGIWPRGNGILTNFGEGTYACVKAFAQAANEAGSLDPERLVNTLKNINVSAPQGMIQMNPRHHHARVNTYLSCCRADGKFELIESFGAIEPELPERYNHQRIIDQATLEEDIRLQARMLEQMSEAVLLVSSHDDLILYSNAGAEKIFGYSREEIVGLSLTQLNNIKSNHTQPAIAAEIVDSLNHKGEWHGEIHSIRKDGAPIWCSASFSTFTHPVHGEVWLGVYRDITANKSAEAALRESEARYKRAEQGTNDGLWEWNITTGYDYFSPRWLAMLGYETDELPYHVDTFIDLIHPDDKNFTGMAIEQHLQNNQPFDIELRLRCKDGHYLWVRSRGQTLRDPLNKPYLMTGSIIDISERKKTEAELERHRHHLEDLVAERTIELQQQGLRNETILNTAIDGFFSSDTTGRIRNVNPAFCAMLGYSTDELLQMTIPEIEALENPAEVQLHIEKVLTQGYDRFDSIHRCKDGSLIDVEISARLVEISGEQMFYAFARDITPRKQAEQAIISARDEAQRASAAKSEFLSRMSHELRTPLNAILGFGQLLETDPRQPLSEHQTDHVHEILTAGQHLLELVNEVLDLSRVESGHLEIQLEPVPIARVIESCIAQLQPIADEKQIRYTLSLFNSCSVQADTLRLNQLLLNLLSNAIKYNREKGDIEISCMPVSETMLRITIRDSGRGIAADMLPRLFKPFERLESAYDGIEGTGIGLALSKKLVEAMHGKIGVKSVVGEGSTFWFELPIIHSSNAAIPSSEQNTETTISLSPSHKTSTVLYVEDNPANLKLVQKIISTRTNINLLTAVDAESGLAVAFNQPLDLILLDINLPGMNGFDVLQRLRNNPATSNIPVIAITANAMNRDVENGMAAGFNYYLTKPLDIQQFLTIIDKFLIAENIRQIK